MGPRPPPRPLGSGRQQPAPRAGALDRVLPASYLRCPGRLVAFDPSGVQQPHGHAPPGFPLAGARSHARVARAGVIGPTTGVRSRSGWRAAKPSAVIAPIENPARWNVSSPIASTNA